MSVNVSSIKAFAPELSGLDDSVIQVQLDCAALRVNPSKLGINYDCALMYLTAHLVTVSQLGGSAAGGVKSESVGSLSRQFGGSSLTSKTNLDSTAYGKEFLTLLRLSCAGGYTIGSQTC